MFEHVSLYKYELKKRGWLYFMLQLVKQEDNKYKVTRLENKFAENIIKQTEKNILKNYVYIDACVIIA